MVTDLPMTSVVSCQRYSLLSKLMLKSQHFKIIVNRHFVSMSGTEGISGAKIRHYTTKRLGQRHRVLDDDTDNIHETTVQ